MDLASSINCCKIPYSYLCVCKEVGVSHRIKRKKNLTWLGQMSERHKGEQFEDE